MRLFVGRSGSVRRALDWPGDQRVASFSLTSDRVTVLCP